MIFKDALTVYFHPQLNLSILIMNIVYNNLNLHYCISPQHLLNCQPLQHFPLCILHASITLMGCIHLDRKEREQQPMVHPWI